MVLQFCYDQILLDSVSSSTPSPFRLLRIPSFLSCTLHELAEDIFMINQYYLFPVLTRLTATRVDPRAPFRPERMLDNASRRRREILASMAT